MSTSSRRASRPIAVGKKCSRTPGTRVSEPEVAHLVRDHAAQLAGAVGDPVAHDVHLVSTLDETPGPAQEDDRATVADAQDLEGPLGHGRES